MSDWADFWLLQDPNVRFVVLGVILMGATSSVVGVFSLLRKRALVGDAVAHAVLPGVCLAFLIQGTKDPVVLLVGATITGYLALVLTEWLPLHSPIKEDTALALVLSTFFGLGIWLLTIIQQTGNASQAGLDKFLFGQAASITPHDVRVFAGIAALVLLSVLVFYKELKLFSFDPDFARTAGIPTGFIRWLLSVLTVLSVVVGIQAMGVVLLSALLIAPGAAARFWGQRLSKLLVVAVVIGSFSALGGAYISYTTPRMPTGPWIVLALALIAFLSLLFGPKKGLLARWSQQLKNQRQTATENILKALYQLGEQSGTHAPITLQEIQAKRSLPAKQFQRVARQLTRQELVVRSANSFALTEKGLDKARRIVRLHRLWEVYLSQYLALSPGQVHSDAESMEHLITPDLEARLEKLLERPTHDPHQAPIPY